MTQVFYCSTFFGAMELCAAIDSGSFGAHTDRRLLITSANAAVPEISMRVEQSPGFAAVRARFDEVVQWNEIIAPMHPSGWQPPAAELPMLARWLRGQLGLDDVVRDVAVESIAVAPARTIVMLLPDSPVTVFSDGLMSYGPTRLQLPGDIATRIERLLYLDLVPGLQPLLLRETGAQPVAIPAAAFLDVLSSVPTPCGAEDAAGHPMIVGQYLSAIGLLTPARENELHADMLRALTERGHRDVVFKAHPAAGRAHIRPLRATATALGVQLHVADVAESAEAWFAKARPGLVVSCFSTALFTAARLFELPVATMGCEVALAGLTPFQNSNRIPVTIVDATVPRLERGGLVCNPPAADVVGLVRAVGYCMQPVHGAPLRDDAVEYVRAHPTARYFKRRRLESLGLLFVSNRRLPRMRRVYRRARKAISAPRASGSR